MPRISQTQPVRICPLIENHVLDSVLEEIDARIDVDPENSDIVICGPEDLDIIRDKAGKKAKIVCCMEADEEKAFLTEHMGGVSDIWLLPLGRARTELRLHHLIAETRAAELDSMHLAWLDTLMDSVPDMVWFKDTNGVHLKVNKAFCAACGKTKKMVEGQKHEYIWNASDGGCSDSENEVMRTGKLGIFNEILQIGNKKRQLRTCKAPIYQKDKLFGTIGVAHDITNILNLNLEIEIFIEAMPFPLAMLDKDGTITHLNRHFLQFFGEKKQDMVGTSYSAWKEWAFEQELSPINGEVFLRLRQDENRRLVSVTETDLIDVFNNIFGKVCVFRDVTAEKDLERHVWRNANQDTLTGLFNRHALNNYAQKQAALPMHLIYIDLDNFKSVNDTHGHKAGDDILKKIAELLNEVFNEDFIARLGGDEFLICVSREVPVEEMERQADTLQKKVHAWLKESEKFNQVSLSFGIRPDSGERPGIDQMIREADSAMYQAKNAGKGRSVIWRGEENGSGI